MSKQSGKPEKTAPEKSQELPDALLDKIAGGGLTGIHAEDPKSAGRPAKIE